MTSPTKFAALLTRSIRAIAFHNNKTIASVQDSLGYAIGRDGGSAIEYWRKGHVPADPHDVLALAQELVNQGGLEEEECAQFLQSAGLSNSNRQTRQMFSSINQSKSSKPLERNLQPFVVGPPITEPRQFFGREHQLKRIFNWWWSRFPLQSVALVGPKRSGKTSLLHYLRNITRTPDSDLRPNQFKNWLPNPESYQWVIVDFQDYRMATRERLLAHILEMLQAPIPDPCNLSNFMDIIIDQFQLPTIILMDEIGAALASPELDLHFWGSLRSLISQYAQGNLAFLLTAHELPNQLATEQGKSSPFFNIFNTVKLGPLTEAEARELVASSPQPFSLDDVDWILNQSQHWPALLQILCQTRLMALEDEGINEDWKNEGQQRIAPFRYLLNSTSSDVW